MSPHTWCNFLRPLPAQSHRLKFFNKIRQHTSVFIHSIKKNVALRSDCASTPVSRNTRMLRKVEGKRKISNRGGETELSNDSTCVWETYRSKQRTIREKSCISGCHPMMMTSTSSNNETATIINYNNNNNQFLLYLFKLSGRIKAKKT